MPLRIKSKRISKSKKLKKSKYYSKKKGGSIKSIYKDITKTNCEINIDKNVCFGFNHRSSDYKHVDITTKNCKLIIPNGVTVIKDYAFNSWKGKSNSVSIPDTVTFIGNNAFSNCKNIKSIIIPNSVTVIGEDAFLKCESLKNVIIPNKLTKMLKDRWKQGAFHGCSGLEEVTWEFEDPNKPIDKNKIEWPFTFCEKLKTVKTNNKNLKDLCEDKKVNFVPL